jgi:hypothetical protein
MKKAILFLMIFLIGSLLFAQQKYALVIGNARYTGISTLNNPENDAHAMETALRNLGFTVEKIINGNLEDMENAILNFKRRLGSSRNTYGFFFYAGHGVQANGENYLIPVTADNIRAEVQLRDRSVSLQFVLNSMNEAGNELNMIVLDACRDNPFSWARGGRGFVPVSFAPSGSIIMYATGANSTADDGSGQNGLFTGHLLNNLRTEGLSIFEVFDRTMGDVIRVTNGSQHPELSLRFAGAANAYLGTRPTPRPSPEPTPQPPQPSPSHTPLQLGSSVNGNISAGGEYLYSVTPTSNGNITVETTGSTDTYMYAYNANNNELASNDDGGEGYNAKITISVSANQTYYFKVRGFSSTTTGAYRIAANYSGGSTASSIRLQLGASVSGNITAGGEYWYSVTPAGNGNITVETTGSTDTYMTAYNASNNELASNDDGGQDYNAKITISASANQTYYFKVRGYSSTTTGAYSVVANYSGGTRESPTLLQFGTSVSGNISGGGEYWYSVTPTGNGSITVETIGSTDTYMYAYNASNNELASNDDGGEGNNARITISVSANQTYYFKVRGYSSTTTGSYSIAASYSAGGMASSTPLQLGASVSGNISAGGEYWYSVRPTSNGNITVETSGSTDTYMYAYNSSNNELASNDDGGEGNNAKITIPASANQTYYFKVRGYSSTTTGAYRIVANFASGGMASSTPLQIGASVSGNISGGGEYWYSVRPTSNGSITVETTGSTDTYMYAYNATNDELASNDDDGQDYNAKITISVLANQTYYFKVRG